jgi:alcohol dehydrogenase
MLAARRFPFESIPRRVAGLDDADALLATMAGHGDIPPVHAVVVPS